MNSIITKRFVNSILAGAMISIAANVYLNCANKFVGAFLFAIGLIAIIEFKFELFTGKIGYATTKAAKFYPTTHRGLAIIYLGNMIGSTLSFYNVGAAAQMYQIKISGNLFIAFIKAIICGILIYIAVEGAKHYEGTGKYLFTIFAIPAFILCGAEHCIADMSYMFSACNFSPRSILFILVVTVGNAIGSIVFHKLYQSMQKIHE